MIKRDFISQGRFLNQVPPEIFNYVQKIVLDNSKDRSPMACFAGNRYRGLGVDIAWGLCTDALEKRQKQIEEGSLARQRTKYRNTRNKYKRC